MDNQAKEDNARRTDFPLPEDRSFMLCDECVDAQKFFNQVLCKVLYRPMYVSPCPICIGHIARYTSTSISTEGRGNNGYYLFDISNLEAGCEDTQHHRTSKCNQRAFIRVPWEYFFYSVQEVSNIGQADPNTRIKLLWKRLLRCNRFAHTEIQHSRKMPSNFSHRYEAVDTDRVYMCHMILQMELPPGSYTAAGPTAQDLYITDKEAVLPVGLIAVLEEVPATLLLHSLIDL